MKTADLLSEVERMISAGEWPERIATRLKYSRPEVLYKRLNAEGRRDVSDRIRQLDKTSLAYQLAHYTPMDEVVSREKASRAAEKKGKPVTKSNNPGMTSAESRDLASLMSIVPAGSQEWMKHGACVKPHPTSEAHQKYADQWFASERKPGRPKSDNPKESAETARARLVCASCKFTSECLMYAMLNKEGHGVWGGLTPDERDELRKNNATKYGRPSDGRCKRGHDAKYRVSDGRGSSLCRKCSTQAKHAVGAA